MPSRRAVTRWLEDTCVQGDVVLVGGRNLCSRVIQRVSHSRYSHVGVVTADRKITEAYERNFTMCERDAPAKTITFGDFASRSKLSEFSVMRPGDGSINRAKLERTADEYVARGIPYPTLGGMVLIVGLFIGRTASSKRARWLRPDQTLIRLQTKLWGDGLHRMHCSELAFRLLAEAGLDLEFDEPPLLSAYIDAIPSVRATDPLDRTRDRFARRFGERMPGLRGISTRLSSPSQPDVADFVLPGDIANATQLHHVATLSVDRQGTIGVVEGPPHTGLASVKGNP